jgi:hypothetical protein
MLAFFSRQLFASYEPARLRVFTTAFLGHSKGSDPLCRGSSMALHCRAYGLAVYCCLSGIVYYMQDPYVEALSLANSGSLGLVACSAAFGHLVRHSASWSSSIGLVCGQVLGHSVSYVVLPDTSCSCL